MKIVLALLIVGIVAGCGRKGPPSAPGPADKIDYPRGYPPAAT